VRVDRDVVGVLAAERRLGRAIFQKIARHPVILAGTREVFHGLAEIAAVRLGAAFAGRADEHERKTRLERHGDERGLAVARDAFNADVPSIHGRQRLKIIESARRAPTPGAQRTPLLRRAVVALVGEPDDASGESGAVVGLDA